jgi:NADH:ubiquinone oxidoreductase subunit F (NADH-binding)
LRRALGPEGVVLREVSCLGRCDAAPAGNVSAASSGRAGGRDQLVDLRDVAAVAAALRGSASADRPVRRWAADPYASEDEHFSALRDALEDPTAPAALCRIIEEAGLRGMGGAGFPTGRKWSLVAAQPATPKHVICNADESEPGTFKDREILHDLPHLVIEGMALAALAVGAERGTVFIRHEYGPERLRVEQAIERARSCGALGSSVFGSDLAFDVDVFVSPGGYILGEETALLECMEDRRGEPRNKPPYPGEHGLRGMPTLINNVETFAHAAAIVRKGADWWRSLGRRGRAGHKFMAVSGDVAEPGVVLVPFGTTLRELLEACGGARGGGGISAVAPGGASSNFLGEEELDVELDFDSLQQAGSMLGSGAAIFVGEGRDLFEVGLDVTRFFRNESCGKCVPCRVGTEKAVKLAEQADDREELARSLQSLHRTLERTSICGLGQVALAPLLSVLARSAWVDGAETGGRDRG